MVMERINHQTVSLSPGRHHTPADGMCVMELASVLADEPFSDRPRSVSANLAALLRGYNDGIDDARRQALKRFAAASIGTAGSRAAERRRRAIIRAAFSDLRAPGGFWSAVVRRYAAADAYPAARSLGRRVAVGDDEQLHRRILALVDELVAVERRDGRAQVGD
jgi:hypothetical protein